METLACITLTGVGGRAVEREALEPAPGPGGQRWGFVGV